MLCPSNNVKVIKLHDTKFYCCEDYKIINLGYSDYKFCPYCGKRLTIDGF